MPTVAPLPIEITLPKIPVEVPPPPEWKITKPRIWIHDPIPLEIEFPVHRPRTVELPLKIEVPGVGTFEIGLELKLEESVHA